MKVYKREYGYEIADSLIASHCACALAFTTRAESEAWRRELGIETPEEENTHGEVSGTSDPHDASPSSSQENGGCSEASPPEDREDS